MTGGKGWGGLSGEVQRDKRTVAKRGSEAGGVGGGWRVRGVPGEGQIKVWGSEAETPSGLWTLITSAAASGAASAVAG